MNHIIPGVLSLLLLVSNVQAYGLNESENQTSLATDVNRETGETRIPLPYSQKQTSITNNSNYSSKNEIANALLEQFKEIVFKKLSSNSSNKVAMSNSSIPVPIVVGIVTANGTQVSGYGNISSSNDTEVDGNTVFDIASIAKTFVTIILANMIKQGLVNLDDPIETF